ncbi:MAG: VWA domain-containing protein [Nanoarchaeota archaeon]|nr:VWA domain-containing protein [Nanoarchaeota archaeon]
MKFGPILLAMLIVCAALPAINAQETDSICSQYQTKCITRPEIDVVFVIDSTGSMNDEIRTIKTHLTKIVKEVRDGQPSPLLRVGVVAYRDYEKEEREYLYQRFDLTEDIDSALNFIWNIEARGGGDLPEAVEYGLHVAINDMSWNYYTMTQNQDVISRPNTKKLIFLIGDASPHGEGSADQNYVQGPPEGFDYRDMVSEAIDRGITIYTVSGSGIDDVGVRVFKEIARKTGGDYNQLSYIRQDVEEYYQQEGFSEQEIKVYAAEARKSADYDKKSNSILTNTLGMFAKSTMKAEAVEMGVDYDEPAAKDPVETENWIDTSDITGSVVAEPARQAQRNIFQIIFDKIIFWN